MLSTPHPSTIPLSAKKHDALQRMMPHIPPEHRSFFEALPWDNDHAAESESCSQDTESSRILEARKQRMLEDDRFLAEFDPFLPEVQNTLHEHKE